MPPRRTLPRFRLIGRGVYTLADASQLTDVPVDRVRRWTHGYDYCYRGAVRHSAPLVGGGPDSPRTERRVLSFLDLLEVRFLEAFRQYGVSIWSIRVAAQRAREIIGHERPFSTRRFRTDGQTILAEIDRETNDPVLVDLVRDQVEFRKIVSDYLYAGVEFDDDDQPFRWWPLGRGRSVVIDPELSFGAPIIARKRLPTRVVRQAVAGMESEQAVAEWYALTEDEVSDAVEFERQLAR